MSAIEVKRLGDGSTRTFDISEVGDGTVVGWVTANDPNADGLARFLNQANETGNAMAPELDRFPKIVENGSLMTDDNGNSTVDWNRKQDGFETDLSNISGVSPSESQTVELTVDVDNLKGDSQTIVNSNGLRVWERDGKIKATISNPNVQPEKVFEPIPEVIGGIESYDDDVYFFQKFNFGEGVQKWNEQNETLESVGQGGNFSSSGRGDIIVYDDRLWVQDDWRDRLKAYDGNSWEITMQFPEYMDGSDIFFKNDGSKYYQTLREFRDKVSFVQWDLSSSYEIDTATFGGFFASEETDVLPYGIYVRPNGEELWITSSKPNSGDPGVVKYDLSTPWEVSTASRSDTFTFGEIGSSEVVQNIFFKPDGTKAFIKGENDIYGYSLGTSWDLSTTSFTGNSIGYGGSGSVTDQHPGLEFLDDGTVMYVQGESDIEIITLSSPWVMQSSSRSSVSITNFEDGNNTGNLENPGGFSFNGDETKFFYATGWYGVDADSEYPDRINLYNTAHKQYSLSTHGDLSAPTFNGKANGSSGIAYHVTAMMVYRGDLYTYNAYTPQLWRYDGSDWEKVLSAQDFFDVLPDRHKPSKTGGGGLAQNQVGGGVWKDKILLAEKRGTNEFDTLYSWTPENGIEVLIETGASENAITGRPVWSMASTPPYKGTIYGLTWFRQPSPGSDEDDARAHGVFDKNKGVYRWAWTDEDAGQSLNAQMGSIVYAGDMYLTQEFFYSSSAEGVWRWDGENIEKAIQSGDDEGWKSLAVHEGELWAANGFGGGSIWRLGNGAEVKVDYDETKSEIAIEAAVVPGALYLNVDGTTAEKQHNVDYEQTESIRLGLSFGSGNSDQHARNDEVFKGSTREFLWYPALTENAFNAVVDEAALFATTQIDFQADTEIFGTASTNLPVDNISSIEVQAASSSGGSFQTIESVSDPSSSSVTFTHSGLTTGEDYFYKTVVTPIFSGANQVESPEVSAVVEYQVSPTLSVTRVSGTEASGSIEAPNGFRPTIQKYEIFRKPQSGSSFSKSSEVVTSSQSTTFTESDLTSGTTYEYKARVIDSNGGDTPFSGIQTVFPSSGSESDSDLTLGIQDLSTSETSELTLGIEDTSTTESSELTLGIE